MNIGFGQLILILVIILVLFGAGRITKVMGELGKGLRAFKAGLEGDGNAEKDLPQAIEVKKRRIPKKEP